MSIPGKLVPEALKTLGKDRVTVSYPKEKRTMPDRFRGAVEFEPDPCTGCGMCERHCAADAISVETDADGNVTWSYDVAKCMFCGQCEESCPTDAIVMGKKFELADSDKPSFEESYTFER
jgi:formate hydrogenlyase subunit 6/NADH:ubiquinone oxidoreductase subunit I